MKSLFTMLIAGIGMFNSNAIANVKSITNENFKLGQVTSWEIKDANEFQGWVNFTTDVIKIRFYMNSFVDDNDKQYPADQVILLQRQS